MLDRGNHVRALDSQHLVADHDAGQIRVFARIFEIAAIARLACKIEPAGKHDIEVLGVRFRADHGAAFPRQFRIPGRGLREARRQRGCAIGVALGQWSGNTEPGIGFVKGRDAEPRDAPYCYQCGNAMQRAGSCYVCGSCGTTSGCS